VPLDKLTEVAPRPDPVVHPEVAGFWVGLADGELRVQVCSVCGTYRYPFAPVCFNCRSFESTWEPISPDGVVAAAVRVRRATGEQEWQAHVPFLSGIVELEHGLRLPGRIACTCGEALRRGTAVRAVVMPAGGGGIDVHGFAHSCVSANG